MGAAGSELNQVSDRRCAAEGCVRYDKLNSDMPFRPTRRDFLQKTAGIGAIALPAVHLASAQQRKKISANDKIRLAAIGLGIMGNKDCVTALKVPGVELVAACDLYTGRLDAAKEKYGSDVAVTKDYRALLERSDIDAVIVATCDKWHYKIAKDALEKGKAVYCEKPMVRQISEGLDVVNTARKTGGVMQVGSQWVSSIVFQKAREQFRAGAIGQLNCIEASYDRQSALGAWEYTIPTDASPATVDWDRYIAGDPHIPYDEKKFFWWRNYRDFGTGVAGDLFVHLISGVHVVTGAKGPVRVFSSGETSYWKDGRDVPDVMTAIMDYPETSGASEVSNHAAGRLRQWQWRESGYPIRRQRRGDADGLAHVLRGASRHAQSARDWWMGLARYLSESNASRVTQALRREVFCRRQTSSGA